MSLNLPREGTSNGGSALPGSSDDGLLVLALRKMMKKEMEVMVISTFEKLIVPMMENLIRKIVKEEIQSAQQMFMTRGNGNCTQEITMSAQSRSLQLKFLDEVSLPVLTGKEIKGKGGTAMQLALVDNRGDFVKSGPEASAKVEILLLQADHNDNDHNWSTEDFNNKIIKESDKEKPHFAKGMCVYLKEGVGILSDVKLRHGSSWKKRCICRLGAKFVDNYSGSRVKEALTESFMVEDRRGKLYEKHNQPFLDDAVWRLKKIGKDGERCKRLYKENIFTVQDFLILLSIDPQKLKRIFAGSKEWKVTVDHARTCIIDDKKISLFRSPTFSFFVAFDAVAQLRGIVRDSHYVQLDTLSEVEQASARELLLLAFENRKDIKFIDDETSLVNKFPYGSNDICVATNSELNDENAPLEQDTSSLTNGSSMCPLNNLSLLGTERMQQICGPSSTVPDQGPSSSMIALGSNQALCDPSLIVPDQGPSSSMIALGSNQVLCDPSLIVPYQGPSSSVIALVSNQALCDPSLIVRHQGPSSSPIALGSNQVSCDPSLTSLIVYDQGPIFSPDVLGFYETLSDLLPIPNYLLDPGDNERISLNFHHSNHHSQTCAESCSGQLSNVGSIRFFAAVGLMKWVSRVRKRVMSICDIDVQKRRRIS